MSDEIIKDLWEIKDSFAREHGYDIERLVAYLRTRQRPKGHPVVDLRPVREGSHHATLLESRNHGQCESNI